MPWRFAKTVYISFCSWSFAFAYLKDNNIQGICKFHFWIFFSYTYREFIYSKAILSFFWYETDLYFYVLYINLLLYHWCQKWQKLCLMWTLLYGAIYFMYCKKYFHNHIQSHRLVVYKFYFSSFCMKICVYYIGIFSSQSYIYNTYIIAQ